MIILHSLFIITDRNHGKSFKYPENRLIAGKKSQNKSLPPKNMRSTEIKNLQKDMVLLEGQDALKNTEETLASKKELA